jgi:hypothetical protein
MVSTLTACPVVDIRSTLAYIRDNVTTPRKPPRTLTFLVRLSPVERQRLKATADRLGLSESEVLRRGVALLAERTTTGRRED